MMERPGVCDGNLDRPKRRKGALMKTSKKIAVGMATWLPSLVECMRSARSILVASAHRDDRVPTMQS